MSRSLRRLDLHAPCSQAPLHRRVLPATRRRRSFERPHTSSHWHHVGQARRSVRGPKVSHALAVDDSAQTNEVGSEHRKNNGPFAQIAPVYASNTAGRSPASASESDSNASGSSRTPFQSTFKTLAHPSAISDNVFDELETRRPTSWQFELHQCEYHDSDRSDPEPDALTTLDVVEQYKTSTRSSATRKSTS